MQKILNVIQSYVTLLTLWFIFSRFKRDYARVMFPRGINPSGNKPIMNDGYDDYSWVEWSYVDDETKYRASTEMVS